MITQFNSKSYRWSPTAIAILLVLGGISLINAQQPGTSRQSASSQLGSAFSPDLIRDPNTGLEFNRAAGITGSKDVISMTYHGTHVDMSPNGRFLLYMSYIVPLVDGEPRRLTNGDLGIGRVRWSPDGTMIAFYSDGGIWVMPISQETGQTTGPAKKLVDGEHWYQFSVQWSPDSERLVYRADGHLRVVSVQDETTTQVTTENAARKIQGGWSPDGRWIAYNQEDNSIWIVPSEGGQPRKLADVTGRGIPHWTPDGQWVFCQWNRLIRFIRVSDGLIADVTVPKGVGAFISWSPDRETMLFYKPSYVWKDMLRVISASGGRPIMPDVSSTGKPMWTHDGRFIFTWGEYQDRYLYWVTPFGAGAASPHPLLLDRPYGYVPGRTAYAQESLSPSKEKLLFTSHTESGQPEYWAVPVSASHGKSTGPAVKVFDKGPCKRDACWSPDESRIALMYEGDLWIAHTDGSPPVRFTAAAHRNVMRRAWSPDGNMISWISYDPNTGQAALRIRPLSGDQPREIVRTKKIIRHSWSPDGTWIAYELRENKPGTTRELFVLFVVRAAGGEPIRLIEGPRDDHHAAFGYAWCPKESQIALLAGSKLLTLDPTSGQQREVGVLPDPVWGRCLDMQWSPDGKTLGLVLEARPNSRRGGEDISGTTRLFTVTIPEGEWTELAGKAGTNYYCVWSPDGKWIAYNSEGWIRTRPEGIVWKVEVDEFLRRAAEEASLPQVSVAESEATTVRRVGYEWRGPFASLSPDGKYMSDRDWDTGALVIRELATGKTRTLVDRNSPGAGSPMVSVISPDSKEVAYLGHDPKKNASSLNIVSLDGEDHRVLCEGKWLMPRDWSSDGKKVLAVVEENDIWQMVWISVSDGSLEHIASVGTSYPGKLDLSPDGRLIAYDCPQPEDTSKRDVFVFDLRENRELSVVNHPADDRFLGWTPDGKHIFFSSDRTGTWDAWLLPVANGNPQGFPKLARHGIGNITPIGFTPQGSYYYGHEQTLVDVFVAKLDLETGEFLSEPMPVRQSGATGCHDWSPDGKYLAYCERRSDQSQAVHIRTLSTGRERTLSGNLPNIRWLRWSPDMRSILTDGYNRGDSQGAISKIDVKTGERSDIVRSKTDVLLRPEMSPDGKTLFYERSSDPMSKTSRLIARHLESGREKELVRLVPPARLTNRALSPDGQRFVLSILPNPDRPLAPVLKILPVAGGEPEELIQFDKSENLRAVGVTWTPDSRNVLFWKWCFPADKELELWRISAGGGKPRRLCSRKAFGHLRVHPDGQRVAFHDRSTMRGLWVMEDFLPESIGGK